MRWLALFHDGAANSLVPGAFLLPGSAGERGAEVPSRWERFRNDEKTAIRLIGVGEMGARAASASHDHFETSRVPAAKARTLLETPELGEGVSGQDRDCPCAVLVMDEATLHANPVVRTHGERLVCSNVLTLCFVASTDPPTAASHTIRKATMGAYRGMAHVLAHIYTGECADASERVSGVVRGFIGKLVHPGLICVDMRELRQVLLRPSHGSREVPFLGCCGIGQGTGRSRAADAAHDALASTGFSPSQLRRVFQAVVFVRHDGDMTLRELDIVTATVRATLGFGTQVLAGDFFELQSSGLLEVCLLLLVG